MPIKTIAELAQLLTEKPAEFLKLGKTYLAEEKAMKKKVEAFTVSIPEQGLYLFTLRRDYERQQSMTPIPPTVAGRSFAEYARSYLSVEDLNNHAESCGNAARLIHAGLITEDDYTNVSAGGKYEALERASRILTKAKDDFKHAAVVETAGLLKQRPADLLKRLQAILKRFVTSEVDGEEVTTFLTAEEAAENAGKIAPEKAAEMATTLAKQDPGFLLAELSAIAQTTTDEATAKRLIAGILAIQAAFAENKGTDGKRRFTPEMLNEWAAEINPPKSMTLEDYKANYVAALTTAAEIESMMAEAGNDKITEKWASEANVSTVAEEVAGK